ncbi:GGDEF domain-containing protein [Vibrio sp. MACH09]|uniref:GGDEF domain-containing protein n=1 Tax=unclassified Vibrio TaxID=2614977 RepID=UPI001493C437|nr:MULTISPECIES: GGDEF domain-containing protein [unclassified Vibrio]NOI66780.1 diguanylate cyclase [Vibrio sp. 99-8-1]GLO62833.1 GGDEF domain-containing protein [Vibrio sp. MACH09]
MDKLLSKVSDAGLDPSSVSGEEAIIFWDHILQHIATSQREKAYCYLISAEYRSQLNQNSQSIDELKKALDLLILPDNVEEIITIRSSLSARLVESGLYTEALQEFVDLSSLAVEYSLIDEYAQAVLGMGSLCDAYGDHAKALRYYQKIDGIDHALTSRSLRLNYKLNMVACLISLNRVNAARELLAECEELSILVSDKILAGQIVLYQAQLERREKNYHQALVTLTKTHYLVNRHHAYWLANMLRLEQARNLTEIGKVELASIILQSTTKKIRTTSSPLLLQKLYDSLSRVFMNQGQFQQALTFEKMGYRVSTDLIKSIPISDLGAHQLRRLSRFELQLKLIMSEQENKELKETTENQKDTVAKLQQDVFTDPLTSLHNRRWMEVKLKDLLLHDTPFAFLVIDIDHFKSINDELSHLVGDKAIVNVSQELKSHFKFKGASCVRFGGEEFLVILENANLDRAQMHAEHYRERIYQYGWKEVLGERGLTVSIGVTMHMDGENTQRTFYRADKALYRAKANGRNQVCVEE